MVNIAIRLTCSKKFKTSAASKPYNDLNNTRTETDFNGESTTYRYDERNRLVDVDYTDDADVSYTYTTTGQVHTITDGRGTTEFGYDAQNRLLWRNDPDGPTTANGHTIEYEYDAIGNRTAVITPNGEVTYTYDERNRLATVTDPDNGLTTYTYDDGNNLVRTAFPNDTAEIRGYDDLNRLTSLKTVHIDPVTGTETVLSGFDYTLNDAGHRLQVTEANGRVVDYTYDSLYRLTQESINNGERVFAYTYDDVGNRLTKSDIHNGSTALTTYTYDSHDRLQTEVLTQDGTEVHTIEYNYDPNGNLISRTQISAEGSTEATIYTWNDDDRLVKVDTPTNVVEYEYDTEGIRVSSTVDGETTDYLIDKNQPYAQVLEEFRSGDLETFYVYGHDLISQERNGEQDVYHVDGLGSTRGLTDEDGNVTDTYDYEAFGEAIDSTGESENSYRFAGEQFDEAIGDYYLCDRFYDQSSGRFLRRDVYEGSIFEPLSTHKYMYANANPSNMVDPSGFFSISEILASRVVRRILIGISLWQGAGLLSPLVSERATRGRAALTASPDDIIVGIYSWDTAPWGHASITVDGTVYNQAGAANPNGSLGMLFGDGWYTRTSESAWEASLRSDNVDQLVQRYAITLSAADRQRARSYLDGEFERSTPDPEGRNDPNTTRLRNYRFADRNCAALTSGALPWWITAAVPISGHVSPYHLRSNLDILSLLPFGNVTRLTDVTL